VTAARPKLDIDTTRERLLALGCMHAAEQLEQMLAEAVRQEVPGTASWIVCCRRSCPGARGGG
jgi:hypothetical protein